MSAHTPGRLVIGKRRGAVFPIESDAPAVQGQIVADVGFGASGEVDIANARRLVACWNACEKVSLEDLEAINRPADVSFAVNVDRLVRERDSLRAVNAELLEALKVAFIQNEHDMLMTGEELRKCSAAIARATAQAGRALLENKS